MRHMRCFCYEYFSQAIEVILFSDNDKMNKATVIKKKICLLGSFAVGKTSLVERFVHNRFDEKYLTTIGVKISQKLLPPSAATTSGSSIQHTFLIWDIAGHEKFDSVNTQYFRGAAGALAVADLTRPDTISDLFGVCQKFQRINPQAFFQIIGNKADLFDDDPSVGSELQKVAATYTGQVSITSAKTGENVEKAFLSLSHRMVDAE